MSNNTRLRKRSSAPLSDESSSRPPSPTQQQPSKRQRTGGKKVLTRPVTRSRTRPTITTTATTYAGRPNTRPAQGPAPTLPVGVPATVTQQVVYTALSRDEDEEQGDESDEEGVEEDEGDEDDDDEEEEEEEEEDGTESEEQDDSQDEDYEDEDDNEDNCKRRKDFDKNRREYENDMLHRQREKEGESDVHADDEASSQEDSSQGYPAAATTAPMTVIDEEEVEDGEEPEMLETVEENYQRFYSHGDFDGDDSSSAMDGAGSTSSSSRSSSSSSSGRRNDNSRCGNGVSASSSLSLSASASKARSRYTSGLSGDGEQFRNHAIQEPLPGTLQTHLIEIDSPPASENGEEEAPRVRYHPEHFIVRERINDMYRLLAHNERNFLDQTPPSSPTSPLSASRILALSQALSLAGRSLNTVSDLMDLLVRTYLPQFWLYRAKNKHLNRFARKQPKNPRPRESTLLATCVDCGFKFEKTPVFAPPATVRKVDNEKRALDNEKKQGRGNKNTRAAAKERALISATFLRKYYQDRFPGAGIHYWNSHLTPQDVDDIFNNNRQEGDYDGNLDHFGLKEEGHHVDCPTNFYSTSEKATKLHFGWDLAVGYQHAGIPRFPDPQRTAPPPPLQSPCPPQPHCHSLAPPGIPTPSPSPRSSPPRTPKPGSGTPPSQHQQHPHPRPHTYYPARSLMASFCHLLPRDLDLTTNDLRKLFTYFVWHPWFDCDFQAITIRRGYEELWPLFLLRDEDDEVTEQEKQVENENIFETKKKKRLEAALRKLETKKHGGKGAIKRKQKLPMAPKAPELPLTPAYIEYKRQTQMETRFTTSFERGLSNHGVIRTIRNRSLEEYTRVARQVRWGWVFGPRLHQHQSQDQGQNQDRGQDLGHTAATSPAAPHIIHFEKNPTYPGSIHIFTANDRTLVEKGGKLYFEPDEWYPVEEIPRFQNTVWTRPERADALDRLKREVKEWWNKDAEVQRKKLGFMLPEFARVRRWPAGMLEMVAGKLVFEVDKSVVEEEVETESLVAQTRTLARATTKPPPVKTRQATTEIVNRREVYMDIDYSPKTSTTDRYRPVTSYVRAARSTVAAARVRSQSQVQDMDMDVEMTSTSTSTSRARAVPPWKPSPKSGRGQQQPSQPQHYQVRTPATTAISTSSSRTQLPWAPAAAGSRQSQLHQAQPRPQAQHHPVQPHFMTVIPSTNTNVNTVARPMAVATGLPTTLSLANFSTGAGPMTTSAKPSTTLPSSRVNTVARKMATIGPPPTTFPSTNVNAFPSTNTYINTVAGLMESAGPFTNAYSIHATNVDNFISDLTNPKADFWEIYNQYMQSGGSYRFTPLDNNAAQKQTLVSTAAAAIPTVAQFQPLNSLFTPAALLAQYYSSHPAEPTMGFQGILPGQVTIAPAPYFSVSGQQNNGMNDMSQFLNMGAMRDASIDTSPSSLNGNDLKGGFARMKIGDRLVMMDIEVDEDPMVIR